MNRRRNAPATLKPDRLNWSAGSLGRGWSPLPEAGEGPLTEEDLYLWRFPYDLQTDTGSLFVLLEDHPTLRHYVAKDQLAFVEVAQGFDLKGNRTETGGLFLRPHRFGQLVELVSFAGRAETGVSALVCLVPDDSTGSLLGQEVAGEGSLSLASFTQLYGQVRTPGPETEASLELYAGDLHAQDQNLIEAFQRFEKRLEEDAATLVTGDRTQQRRILHRLLSE